jgi:PIN domain nuclease of toxin-antitoxin system
MNYLLDTHTLLWCLFDQKQLSPNSSSIILDDKNEIFISTVSLWEISLKFSLGKLSLSNILPDQLPSYIRKAGYEIITIDENISSTFYKLSKYDHTDPFDRLLIWQAIISGYILISKDSSFEKYVEDGLQLEW